jgi:uncharacterized membrane protein (UPF0127 family)/Skp family chaperone for outer membrane proteins
MFCRSSFIIHRSSVSTIAVVILCAGTLCRAQSGTSSVGVIDLKLVINNMQETVDDQRIAKEMQEKITTLTTTHQTALKDMQDKLPKETDHQSPAYQQALDDLDQKFLAFGREEREQQIQLARFKNRRLKQAFDEIKAMIADQAKAKGLDLVMLDNSNELSNNPMAIPTQQAMEGEFLNRTLAFKSDQIDFSQELIARLNSTYKPPADLTPMPTLPMTPMQVGQTTFQMEIAADDASRERGMMERDTLAPDHGMIFVFDHASPQAFWMHHTRFSLDIIFADEHGKVVSVHNMKAYDEHTTFSDGPAKYAIELPSGAATKEGVKEGDALHIPSAADAALKK